jgi:hypothetical protein
MVKEVLPETPENIFSVLREKFFGLDKQTRLLIIATFLIVIITPIAISLHFIFQQNAASSNVNSGASLEAQAVVLDNGKLKSMIGATDTEVTAVVNHRRDLMLTLAKNNPKEFIANVLDQATIDKLPQVAKNNIEKRQTLSGVTTVLSIDKKDSGEIVYGVEDDQAKKQYYLNFSDTIPYITTGKKIKADVYTLDNQAVTLANPTSVQIIPESVLGASTTPVTKNVLVIKVLLSDNVTQTYNDADINTALTGAGYSAEAFHKETSYGLVNFTNTLTPYISAPITMTQACNDKLGSYPIVDQAVTAAGYIPANYTIRVYLFPKSSSCGDIGAGTIGSSPTNMYPQKVFYYNNGWSDTSSSQPLYPTASIYAHELGHNLGMDHSDTLNCGSKAIDVYSNCSVTEYGDKYDTIGYGYTYYPQDNGPHKYLLGYFAPSNVINITQSGTYTINTLETNTSSPQIIRIPKSTGDYYYIDYRSNQGFDKMLPSSVINGATLYIGGSSVVVSGAIGKTYLLDTTPGDTSGFANASFTDGVTFSDPASNLTIQQVSHVVGSSVTLNITFSLPTATPTLTTAPTPTTALVPTATLTLVPTSVPVSSCSVDWSHFPSSVVSGQTYTFSTTFNSNFGTIAPSIYLDPGGSTLYRNSNSTGSSLNSVTFNVSFVGPVVGSYTLKPYLNDSTGKGIACNAKTFTTIAQSTPTPTLMPTATSIPTSTPTFTPTPTPLPPSAPKISVGNCIAGPTSGTNNLILSWTDSNVNWVNIGIDSSNTTYYNKSVSGTTNTQSPIGFTGATSSVLGLQFVLNPNTVYYATVWNGVTNKLSAPTSFSIPLCPTPTPVPGDTTSPTIFLTSPFNGSSVRHSSVIAIAATATDNVGVTKVQFSANGKILCTDTVSPYTCSWSVPPKKNVNYVLSATAFDAAGNYAIASVQVIAK